MAKPFLKLSVTPTNASSFVLSFDHAVDMEITREALARSGHTSEPMHPQLGGIVFTPWMINIVMRGTMGERIEAIKMVRVIARVGLKEAKDFVDDYMV